MKYIKNFESNKIPEGDPQIGDFVIVSFPEFALTSSLSYKVKDKIGKIMDYRNLEYRIHFKYVGSTFYCSKEDIVAHSKNIEDMKLFLQARKYNI